MNSRNSIIRYSLIVGLIGILGDCGSNRNPEIDYLEKRHPEIFQASPRVDETREIMEYLSHLEGQN